MRGSIPGPATLPCNGLAVEFETEDETNERFAHIRITDGQIFGKAQQIRESIPPRTWVTVPPHLQPGITWYLCSKVGLRFVMRHPVDGELNDVLYKDN